MPDDSQEYVVVVDSFSVQGMTYSRGDRLTGDQLGHRLPRLLNAGLLSLADPDNGEDFDDPGAIPT